MQSNSPLIYSTHEWQARPVDTSKLPRAKAEGIVIHHTATANRQVPADGFQERELAFHLAREIQHGHIDLRHWPDSGQHFTISRGGLVMEGRTGSAAAAAAGRCIKGTHARNAHANATHYGIELEGNFDDASPTKEQWASLIELCSWLCYRGGFDSTHIFPHASFRPTRCPGLHMRMRIPKLRGEVRRRKIEMMGQACK